MKIYPYQIATVAKFLRENMDSFDCKEEEKNRLRDILKAWESKLKKEGFNLEVNHGSVS